MKTKKSKRERKRDAKILRRHLEARGADFARWATLRDFDDPAFRVIGPDNTISNTAIRFRLNNGKDLVIRVICAHGGIIRCFGPEPDQLAVFVAEGNRRPPAKAESLLSLFLSKAEREGAIGDLDEKFQLKVDSLGRARAVRWLYSEVLRSAWPLLRRRASALLARWLR